MTLDLLNEQLTPLKDATQFLLIAGSTPGRGTAAAVTDNEDIVERPPSPIAKHAQASASPQDVSVVFLPV